MSSFNLQPTIHRSSVEIARETDAPLVLGQRASHACVRGPRRHRGPPGCCAPRPSARLMSARARRMRSRASPRRSPAAHPSPPGGALNDRLFAILAPAWSRPAPPASPASAAKQFRDAAGYSGGRGALDGSFLSRKRRFLRKHQPSEGGTGSLDSQQSQHSTVGAQVHWGYFAGILVLYQRKMCPQDFPYPGTRVHVGASAFTSPKF